MLPKWKLFITVLLAISITVVAIVINFYYPSSPKNLQLWTENELEEKLEIWAYEYNINWIRSPETDLPQYRTFIRYYIYNSGDANATNVSINVLVNNSIFISDSIPLLRPYEQYSNTFNLTVNYDSVTQVSISAHTINSSANATLDIEAKLPRSLSELWGLARLFITPNNRQVQNIVMKHSAFPNWLSLCNWVSDNIEYVDDSVHGQGDYWQLPSETLELKTGDCEDYAILLCSLYRAAGYDAESAFVILGYSDKGGHAWVRIYAQVLGIGTWINIEPQIGGIFTIFYGLFDTTKYDDVYQFNDVFFERLK